MIKVGIIGATGYAGAELVRLLFNHPETEIAAISSVSFEGELLNSVYPSYYKLNSQICESQEDVVDRSDVVFAALPHGLSQEIAELVISKGKVFVDLGADFRLKDEDTYEKWYDGKFINKDLHEQSVYGMPEFFREEIKNTKIIANPGCYTTAVPLGLAPAVKAGLIEMQNIICDCKSGVTGAGRSLSMTTHFPVMNEGFHPYKVANHRHSPEIEQTLSMLSGEEATVTFVPHLIPANRGILATCYSRLKKEISIDELQKIYEDFYKDEYFIRVLPQGSVANIHNVRYSNLCDISVHIDEHTKTLVTVSAIDNMVKGAAGQAIQNMNIIFGLDEKTGLEILPPAF